MLTIIGQERRFCDAVSRRNFLRLGGLALGGLTLADLLRADAQAGNGSSRKSVIMVFLVGGASHIDLFDMKPDAPADIRGEYRPIATKVPGIQICEHLPQTARIMDKLVLLRALVGGTEDHEGHVCLTGYPAGRNGQVPWPSFGSFVAKLKEPIGGSPPFVSLTPEMKYLPWSVASPSGFLGPAYEPFAPLRRPGEDQHLLQDVRLRGITLERLDDRRALLSSFDRFRRDVDSSGILEGIDAYTKQAFHVLTTSALAQAMDLNREDPRVRARYGKGSNENVGNGGPRCMEHFLLARRLIEAGVRCVSLAFSHWDWHANQYQYFKDDLPAFDQGFSALIEDLYARGMDRDVSVVVWGEMGRTPRINKNAGRDHWAKVSTALLSGGGMPTAHAIGSTNRQGEVALDRPVHYQNVFATLYHNMGIDPQTTTVIGRRFGRPEAMHLLDIRDPIRELI